MPIAGMLIVPSTSPWRMSNAAQSSVGMVVVGATVVDVVLVDVVVLDVVAAGAVVAVTGDVVEVRAGVVDDATVAAEVATWLDGGATTVVTIIWLSSLSRRRCARAVWMPVPHSW